METQEIRNLLAEIRDIQRAALHEYQRVANESLALQKLAMERQQEAIARQRVALEAQRKHLLLYRGALIVVSPVLAYMLWLALTKFS